MKRIISYFLIFILFATPAFAQKQKNDLTANDLKGKVKSVKRFGTYRYIQDGVFTEWAPIKSDLSVYDANGNKTECTFYNEDGTFYYKQTFKHDPVAKTKEVSSDYPNSGKTVYTYDDKGNELSEVQYTAAGSLDRKYINTLDDKGNILESKGYKSDGSFLSIRSWKYDSKGNMTEFKSSIGTYTYTYDDKNNRIEEYSYKADGRLFFKYVNKYDDKGNKIESLKYDPAGALKDNNTWKYEYDKQGNWIKKTQTGNTNESFSIEEREIVYF